METMCVCVRGFVFSLLSLLVSEQGSTVGWIVWVARLLDRGFKKPQ